MIRISFFTLILFCLSYSTVFAGGPWPQKKGNGYYKLSEWWLVFDEHFTDVGKLDPNVTTGIYNTFFYAEHGITDRLTGLVNANVFARNYMNNLVSATTNDVLVEGEGINSIGDIDLGLKYGLTRPGANIPIAASIILGLPTGKTEGGSQGNLQTGDGEFNQMIRVDAGKGFKLGDKPAYSSVYAGFNHRTEGFSEELRWGVEVGTALFDSKLWGNVKIDAIESFKNGDTAETVNSTSIFANNTEFISFGLELNYYFTEKWGVSVGAAGAFRGEIIAAAPSYSVGVFLDLSKG